MDLRAALELVPAGLGDAARARVLVSEAKYLAEPHGPEGRIAAEEALTLAQRVGDAGTQVSALCELARIESHSGNDPAALAMFAEARSLARRAGALRPLLHVAINESHVLEGMGEHGRAAEVARAGIASARDYGLARSTGTFLAINVAEPLVSLGRWDEAIDVIEHALALSPPRINRLALRLLAGHVAFRRGDLAGAQELADAARVGLSRAGKQGCREAQYYLPLAQLEAELFLAEGRPADARDVVTAAADRFDLVHDPRYAWPLLAVGARACAAPATVKGPAAAVKGPAAAVKRPAAAERAGDLLGRLCMVAAKVDAWGPVQLAGRLTFAAEAGLGLADEADGGSALAHGSVLAQWDAAAAAWEHAAQPYEVAVALIRAADAAMTAGDRDAAAKRLRRAAELADQLGARPLGEEIGLFARSARLALAAGRDDAIPAPRPRGLTARESEVLRLVAAGRSNPEIAAELFISAKTASVHVSNILAKLGVGSRGEAAAAAYRLRLFDPEPVR
jgi:DNA-binding CsgD family transcriptional regulator